MQMEGKKKKGKERERRRAQGVCQARRTCVVCVCPVLLVGRHCWQSPCGPSLCGVQVQSRYQVKCLNTDISLSPSLSLFFFLFSLLSLLSLLFFFLFFSSFLLTLSVLSTMEEEEGDSLFSLSLSLFLSFSLSSLIGRISPWAWASSVEINVLTHRGAHRGLQKKQRERERREKRGYGWLVAIVRYVTEHKNTKYNTHV